MDRSGETSDMNNFQRNAWSAKTKTKALLEGLGLKIE
jgi:hypothetical protein